MRVLLDENLPLDVAKSLPGHEVTTVHALGWDGLQNGALLDRAAGRCAFVTMDANLKFQQRLQGRHRHAVQEERAEQVRRRRDVPRSLVNPEVRLGKPCLFGTRIDVATIVGAVAAVEAVEAVAK